MSPVPVEVATLGVPTGGGRVPASVTRTALSIADGNIKTAGADHFQFEIVNTHGTDDITVTAVRSLNCPTCGHNADPSGKGTVTLTAGQSKVIGPFRADLYGSDILFAVSSTGSGTGNIVAIPV